MVRSPRWPRDAGVPVRLRGPPTTRSAIRCRCCRSWRSDRWRGPSGTPRGPRRAGDAGDRAAAGHRARAGAPAGAPVPVRWARASSGTSSRSSLAEHAARRRHAALVAGAVAGGVARGGEAGGGGGLSAGTAVCSASSWPWSPRTSSAGRRGRCARTASRPPARAELRAAGVRRRGGRGRGRDRAAAGERPHGRPSARRRVRQLAFFNRRVDRAARVQIVGAGSSPCCVPGATILRADPATGRVRVRAGRAPSLYVARTGFRDVDLVTDVVATTPSFPVALERPLHPLRVAYVIAGTGNGGWAAPGRAARIRVYAWPGRPARACLTGRCSRRRRAAPCAGACAAARTGRWAGGWRRASRRRCASRCPRARPTCACARRWGRCPAVCAPGSRCRTRASGCAEGRRAPGVGRRRGAGSR